MDTKQPILNLYIGNGTAFDNKVEYQTTQQKTSSPIKGDDEESKLSQLSGYTEQILLGTTHDGNLKGINLRQKQKINRELFGHTLKRWLKNYEQAVREGFCNNTFDIQQLSFIDAFNKCKLKANTKFIRHSIK